MKKLIIFSLFIAFIIGCKTEPKQYTITGSVDSEEPINEVYLREISDTVAIARAKVIDGKFTLIGTVKEPHLVALTFDTDEYREMLLENDDYQVVITDDYKYIKGGNYNEILFGFRHAQDFLDASKIYDDKSAVAYDGLAFGDLKGYDEANKKLRPYLQKVLDIKSKHYASVLEGNAPTLVKLYALSQHYDWTNYDFNRQLELLDEYEKDLPNNEFLIEYRQMIKDELERDKIGQNTKAGKKFIDFTTTGLDGKKIKLSDVIAKNKYTLVEFWASWCGPCRASFPHLKEKYAEYKDKGFEIFGVSIDTEKDRYLKASDEENLPWINTVDYDGFDSKAAQDYAVSGIPYTILISQDGTIIDSGSNIRGLALDDKLKEIYGD